MNRKTIKNYIYTLVYQIVVAITPILTIPYKSRVFFPESIGIYSYVFSVLSYLLMIGSIGITLYGQREIAYVKNDEEKRSKTLIELIVLKSIILTFVSVFFYLIIGIKSIYKIYYLILIPDLVFNIIDTTWFYQGIEEFKKISIINIITRILNVICIFLFIKNDSDLIKYVLITVIFDIFPFIIMILSLKKYIIKVKKIEILKHLKPCLILFIPQICIQIYTVCDKIMLGYLQNNIGEVGYYEYTDKIVQIILKLISSLTIVILPTISYAYKNKDNDKIKKYINESTNIIIFLALPLIFGILGISNNFVEVFFGQEYLKISQLLKIIIFSVLPIGLTGIIEQYLISTKQEKKFTIIIFIGMVINVILNLILIKTYKSIGVSIATIITEFIILIIEIPIFKKFINTKETINYFFRYSIYSIIMVIIIEYIGTLNKTWIGLIIQITTGMMLYLFILTITKDKIFNNFISKIKNKHIYTK